MSKFVNKSYSDHKIVYSNPSKGAFRESFQQVRSSLETRPKELRGPFTKSMNLRGN